MNNDVYVKEGEIREIRERPNVNGCTQTPVGGGPIICKQANGGWRREELQCPCAMRVTDGVVLCVLL